MIFIEMNDIIFNFNKNIFEISLVKFIKRSDDFFSKLLTTFSMYFLIFLLSRRYKITVLNKMAVKINMSLDVHGYNIR